MYIHNLEERIPYNFTVKAQTIGDGPAAMGVVKTGPQTGSPERPRDLALSKTLSSIRLSWSNGKSGSGPILGYYIESRPKGESESPARLSYIFQYFLDQMTVYHIKTCNIICSPRIKVQIINGFCFNIAAFIQQLARIGNYVSLTII